MPAEPPSNTGSEDGPGGRASPGAWRPPTEAEIDSPSSMTLRLLGVVFLLTLLPWAGAKLACNRKDAPIRPPPPLDLEVVVSRPKDTGLELAQRLATGEYREAAELARGALADELVAEAERCEREPSVCAARRRDADRVHTRATLVSRSRDGATVRTEAHRPSTIERYWLELERHDRRWSVVSRRTAPVEASPNPGAPGPDAGP